MTPTPLTLRQRLQIELAVHAELGNATTAELLQQVVQLRVQVAELTKYASDLGWMLQPESMGR